MFKQINISKYLFAIMVCFFSSLCSAEADKAQQFGACGFAGPDHLTNDYYCQRVTQHSTKIKQEAAKQLLLTAWRWITGAAPQPASAQYLDAVESKVKNGNGIGPVYRVKADSDQLMVVVAYEF